MSKPLSADDQKKQSKLKQVLQEEDKASKLEDLAAAVVGRLLNVSIAVAKSGFQHGGDAGPAGRQGRRFRIEAKKYRNTTSLSDRELLGEIDHALARDQALEAWILIATRDVPEQLEQDLTLKGESLGVPVVIIDWKDDSSISPLAALCAFAPDLVETIFSAEAGKLAAELRPVSTERVEQIRQDLQSWNLGFASLRDKSHEKLLRIWNSPAVSNAELGQNAACGTQQRRVRRRAVHQALSSWWAGPAESDSPAAVIGWDGVGKTWATLDWLFENLEQQPIVMIVPSSAAAVLTDISETAVKRFIADRLYELCGIRDRQHWLRRLDYLLKRPTGEGPVMTVFFDGANQEPSVQWLQLLKVFQGELFQSKVRVLVSTRPHHFQEKLSNLRGLVQPAAEVKVDIYDNAPGGELDKMLAFEGLTQTELHPDLAELARTPRLFKLVVRLRERLVDAGQVTVHRLLWEYGRDSFGERAGHSFSEDGWREWLGAVAQTYRDGVRDFSLRGLGETAARPDLSASEVYARLSDIIDGRFATRSASGNLQFTPTVVAHALGMALLGHLDNLTDPDFECANAELNQWLDPIAGLDQRADILRAAVSIFVERGSPKKTSIAVVLVTAWLQTQNVTDQHRRELVGLAPDLPEAILGAVENSRTRAHASARLWAVNALRNIPRSDVQAREIIVSKIRVWLSVVSRDVNQRQNADAEAERQRAQRFITYVGVDVSGPLRILGVTLQFVDHDDGVLAATTPSILEGYPLASVVSAFEVAAISLAVGRHTSAWDGLKWLCMLNMLDPKEASDAIRSLSTNMQRRQPEEGVHVELPARVAALLLWLTGQEMDDESAIAINPNIDRWWTYEKDYLSNPSKSFFALERRHAENALLDTEISLHYRVQRTKELWIDPSFKPPERFVEEIRAFAMEINVELLDRRNTHTIEDHHFADIEPALARCAPEMLAELIRRKIQSFRSCPAEARYWAAYHSTQHLLLVRQEEITSVRMLRESASETSEDNESYASGQLLILELQSQGALTQFSTLIEADLKHTVDGYTHLLKSLLSEEIDFLIVCYGSSSERRRGTLLSLLGLNQQNLSDTACAWIETFLDSADIFKRAVAFKLLASASPIDFGRMLLARNWTWDTGEDPRINHYGTEALIEAAAALPFDQLSPRLAPWRILEAARRRGSDAGETRLAAAIFTQVLLADQVEVPDSGSILSVDLEARRSNPFVFFIRPKTNEDDTADPFAAFRASMNEEEQMAVRRRAVDTAVLRIREARKLGANLFLSDIAVADLEPVLQHAPELVASWLTGLEEVSVDFLRRVRLAEASYLAICELLLKHQPTQGAKLWKALKGVMTTRYTGVVEVDELTHMAFRAPDSPAVDEILGQLTNLDRCNLDQHLQDVALAATYNQKAGWLKKLLAVDGASSFAWQRRRAIRVSGFVVRNDLPVDGAWPEGEIKTDEGRQKHRSASRRHTEACARHWWRAFLASGNAEDAYAAWILFLRSVDRRAWIWMKEEVATVENTGDLFLLKMTHARLNHSEVLRSMKKRDEKLEKEFIGRTVVEGIGPWV